MSSVFDLFSLEGRTALITGATRGIGQALAIALAEAGSDIVLIQRPGSNDRTTAGAVGMLGRRASIFNADLSNADDLKGLIGRITAAGHDIDILVNCGGIQRRHPAHQFPDNDWDEVCMLGAPVTCVANEFTSYTGSPSQPQRRLHTQSRCWSLHAYEATQRQPTTSWIDHQYCVSCLLSGRTECTGVRSSQRRSGTADEESVQPVRHIDSRPAEQILKDDMNMRRRPSC
jgi:hypothetical protein